MTVSLIDLSYDPAHDPVGVNKDFKVTLTLLGDASGDGRVTFWTQAAYAVVPGSIGVTIPAGKTKVDQEITLQLQGQPQDDLVRIYAECDERHSVFVRVR